MLQFASFSFDASLLDVAVVLAAGGTLVVATEVERAEPGLLARMITSVGVAAASVVPSLLGVLDPAGVPGLATVLSGAEVLTAAVAERWAPGRRLVNTYGPTEATVMVTTGPADRAGGQPPPVGSPVANTQAYVLDAYLYPVARPEWRGVVCGRGRAGRCSRRRQPGLTGERFVGVPVRGGRRADVPDRGPGPVDPRWDPDVRRPGR